MIVLRLFLPSAPFQQIDSRIMSEGEITIGRDPSCDWQLKDPGGAISRHHCALRLEDEAVFLVDTSRNGVEIGPNRDTAPKQQQHALAIGDTIYVGNYMLTIDRAKGTDQSNPDPAAIAATGSDPDGLTQGELLASFCDGADLEAGTFAGEDAAAVMTRLGGVYRQMIEDMCSLLRDRAECKAELHLDRTTVGGWGNNPFKWAPPSSIAADLVKDRAGGFLKGAAAVKASFQDLRDHSEALATVSRSSSSAVLEALDPAAVESAVGPDASREDLIEEYRRRHDQLNVDLAEDGSLIGMSYRKAIDGAAG